MMMSALARMSSRAKDINALLKSFPNCVTSPGLENLRKLNLKSLENHQKVKYFIARVASNF